MGRLAEWGVRCSHQAVYLNRKTNRFRLRWPHLLEPLNYTLRHYFGSILAELVGGNVLHCSQEQVTANRGI